MRFRSRSSPPKRRRSLCSQANCASPTRRRAVQPANLPRPSPFARAPPRSRDARCALRDATGQRAVKAEMRALLRRPTRSVGICARAPPREKIGLVCQRASVTQHSHQPSRPARRPCIICANIRCCLANSRVLRRPTAAPRRAAPGPTAAATSRHKCASTRPLPRLGSTCIAARARPRRR